MDDLEELRDKGLTVEEIAEIAVERGLFGDIYLAREYVAITLGIMTSDTVERGKEPDGNNKADRR